MSRLNSLKNQLNGHILWLRPIFGAFLDRRDNFFGGNLENLLNNTYYFSMNHGVLGSVSIQMPFLKLSSAQFGAIFFFYKKCPSFKTNREC
jgi:hypothetical protein